MLRRNGLSEGDYHIERVGGTAQRWEALRQGKQAGTLLSAPFNILAREQQFRELARASGTLGPYQGNVAATRRSWAKENRSKVIAFIRGYVQALDWLYDRLYDPAHRDEAIRILMKNLPEMSQQLAGQTYAELLDPREGFSRKGQMSLDGLQTVLALRSRYAEPKKDLTDPMKYYDPSYVNEALH
jgi:ABC-type nitrate/sulfonate/bicarbonate transport system substrate-binding protein